MQMVKEWRLSEKKNMGKIKEKKKKENGPMLATSYENINAYIYLHLFLYHFIEECKRAIISLIIFGA